MFNTTPIAAKFITSDVPPELKNGSGIPVVGINLVTTAIFTNIWNANIPTIPAAMSIPYISFALGAIVIPLIIQNAKSPTTIVAPTKPNSSAYTAKTKSFCASGSHRYFCLL